MLTVICGEDTKKSREYLYQLRQDFQKKNYVIKTISHSEVEDAEKDISSTHNLFGQEVILQIDNLSAALGRKKKGGFIEAVERLIASPTVQLVDWENGKSAYQLTSLKKNANIFKEFKPEKSIFQLMQLCSPGNKNVCMQTFELVSQTQESTFIFAMLCKHIRTLILAKSESLPPMSPWQKKDILQQAKLWTLPQLLTFYDKLVKIDTTQKTSPVYTMHQALQILFRVSL